ncbi:MAG: DUF2339 domain-containing protein, partial [Acidobacteria bacterium]
MELILVLVALFLGLPVLLVVWLVKLQNRVNQLESENRDKSGRLVSLEARLQAMAERRAAAPERESLVAAAEAAPSPAAPPVPPVPAPAASQTAAAAAIPAGDKKTAPADAPVTRAARDAAAPAAPVGVGPVRVAPPIAPRSAVPPKPRPASSAPLPPRPPVAPPPEPPAPFDWEGLVGVKLFSWIAGIALALGAIFFLKYSIQSGWLQPPVRMAIGLLTGIGLLAGCEMRVARRYAVTANALDAAGLVILFSTVFASHVLWGLLNSFAAFALLSVVTVVAVLLSIRRNSVFIALLGLVGGFATPALLSTGQDNPLGLFGYLLLLNAGLAWVAYYKRWIVLVALSLALTTFYQWGWVFSFLTVEKLPLATAIFLVFPVLAWVLFAMKARTAGDGADRFGKLAALNASLPLLFALHIAAVPGYGDRFQVLFGFLFLVNAGLFAVARTHGPQELHAVGAASTIVVFVSWWTNQYPGMRPEAWRAVLAFVALFVVF